MKIFKVVLTLLLVSTVLYAQDTTVTKNKFSHNLLSANVLGLYSHIGLNYERLNASRFSFSLNAEYNYAAFIGWKAEPAVRFYVGKKGKHTTYLQVKNGFGYYRAFYYDYVIPNQLTTNPDYDSPPEQVLGIGLGVGKRFYLNKSQNLSLDLYGGVQAYTYPVSKLNKENTQVEFFGSKVNAYQFWKRFGPGSYLDLKINLGWRF